MTPVVLKIIAGVIATLGFAIIFKVKPSLLPLVVLDGLVACLGYFLLTPLFDGDFLPNFLSAFAAALCAEIFARIGKSPTTVFIIPGCIALVPGGSLYYAMSNFLSSNYDLATEKFLVALTVGIAIGGGIIAASLIRVFFVNVINRIKSI